MRFPFGRTQYCRKPRRRSDGSTARGAVITTGIPAGAVDALAALSPGRTRFERKIRGRALGRVSNGPRKRCSGNGVRSLMRRGTSFLAVSLNYTVGHKDVNVLVDVRGHASRRPRNSYRSRTSLVSDSTGVGHSESMPVETALPTGTAVVPAQRVVEAGSPVLNERTKGASRAE